MLKTIRETNTTLNRKGKGDISKFNQREYNIIAQILQEIGFSYPLEVDCFQVNKQYYLESYYGWHFYTSKDETVLDAIYDNILHFYPLEVENITAKSIMEIVKIEIKKRI